MVRNQDDETPRSLPTTNISTCWGSWIVRAVSKIVRIPIRVLQEPNAQTVHLRRTHSEKARDALRLTTSQRSLRQQAHRERRSALMPTGMPTGARTLRLLAKSRACRPLVDPVPGSSPGRRAKFTRPGSDARPCSFEPSPVDHSAGPNMNQPAHTALARPPVAGSAPPSSTAS